MSTEEVSQEIVALETDIHELEDAIKEKLREKQLLKAWREFQGGQNTQNIENLKKQINLLERITDVKFERTEVEILQQGKLWLTKRLRIEGSCMEEEFQLQLDMKDLMTEDMNVTSEIMNLLVQHVTVSDKGFLQHIKILEEQRNIQGIFMLLRTYTKWTKIQEVTFQHFSLTYPDIASQKDDHCLQLKHVEKPCIFQIDWLTSISCSHICFPEIKLSVNVQDSGRNDILTKAPDMFQLMLKELGIEKAINCIVSLCSK